MCPSLASQEMPVKLSLELNDKIILNPKELQSKFCIRQLVS